MNISLKRVGTAISALSGARSWWLLRTSPARPMFSMGMREELKSSVAARVPPHQDQGPGHFTQPPRTRTYLRAVIATRIKQQEKATLVVMASGCLGHVPFGEQSEAPQWRLHPEVVEFIFQRYSRVEEWTCLPQRSQPTDHLQLHQGWMPWYRCGQGSTCMPYPRTLSSPRVYQDKVQLLLVALFWWAQVWFLYLISPLEGIPWDIPKAGTFCLKPSVLYP